MLAGEGGDPRLHADSTAGIAGPGSAAYTRPQGRKLHDPSVTFEEYVYWAAKTRAEEDEHHRHAGKVETSWMSLLFPAKSDSGVAFQTEPEKDGHGNEKRPSVSSITNISNAATRAEISDAEWSNASRALRTASWGACFYLITTDILGPFSLPFAFASLGWV